MLRRFTVRRLTSLQFTFRRSTYSLLVIFSFAASVTLALFSNHVPVARAQSKPAQHGGESAGAASVVARGKYLVEGVAMCGECHTPHDSTGNPDRTRWLQGASVPYLPARPDADWPINAPRIGGTPPASDADMIKLLTTGIWSNGNRLRAPMPQFRLDLSDAEAVVAYLKSVTPKQ